MSELRTRSDSGNNELLCPRCHSEYISHKKIEIFEREEDGEEGLHITIAGNVSLDKCLKGNPSARRNGFIARFWCEICHHFSLLRISAHKGRTFVEMVEEK